MTNERLNELLTEAAKIVFGPVKSLDHNGLTADENRLINDACIVFGKHKNALLDKEPK